MAYAAELTNAHLPSPVARHIGGLPGAIVAAGSTISDATLITASLTMVTGADGTKGVILGGQTGDSVCLFNNSASTLKVYPPNALAAIAVNGTGIGTVAAAFSHLTYKSVIYSCISSTQWLANVSA